MRESVDPEHRYRCQTIRRTLTNYRILFRIELSLAVILLVTLVWTRLRILPELVVVVEDFL